MDTIEQATTTSSGRNTDTTRTVRSPRLDNSVELANRLRPVILRLNRQLRRELHSLGVTAGQASLLSSISGAPGIGVKELSEREGMRAPSICVHIDRMEKAGLVERERAGSSDRRRVCLRVTAEGARVLRTVRSRRTAWLAARLETLAPADRKRIDEAIDALGRLIPEMPR